MLDKHVYCVKCQRGKTVVNSSPVMFRNGANAVKGACPSCGGDVYKIVSKEQMKKNLQKEAHVAPSQKSSMVVIGAIFVLGLALGLIVGQVL